MRTLTNFFLFCSFFVIGMTLYSGEDKTVLLAILARDKEHCLPSYLKCIDDLEYDKKKITLYINTNNNQDRTKELLMDWVLKNEKLYAKVLFDCHEIKDFNKINPHQWSSKMFSILATIRNKSMQKALDEKCDYYFVVDCDNFIKPFTLKVLMEKNKPIIAPMLKSIPNPRDSYSNYFCEIDKNGYYKAHPDYLPILNRKKVGTFEAPVVHCTYLIESKYIEKLGYIDGTKDYEFVIFSRGARKNQIKQYICNEKEFGSLIHFGDGEKTLEQEKKMLVEHLQKGSIFSPLKVKEKI
jgi:hypothetical protein